MFEKFSVIDLLNTRSDSVVTISGNSIKFNVPTIVELGYPSHVQFMINEKARQFGIVACKAEAKNSVAFSKPQGEQRYPIKINIPIVTALIRKLTGWSSEDTWTVPGILFAEENGIMYNLDSACPPKQRKKRKSATDGDDPAAAFELESQELEQGSVPPDEE